MKTENNDRGYIGPAFQDDEGMDVKRYISLLFSNWYWFAAAIFISFTLSYGINRYSAPVFNVTSTILIKDDLKNAYAGLPQIFPGTEAYANQQNIKNEIGILKSFELNKKVMLSLRDFHVDYTSVGKRGIAESKQYKTNPFIVDYDTLSEQTLYKEINIKLLPEDKYELLITGVDTLYSLKFGEKFNKHGFNFTVNKRNPEVYAFDKNASNRFYFKFLSPGRLANEYRRKLAIAPVEENATLLTLSVSGFVAEQEADYLNELIDTYINRGLENKNTIADLTISFINDQLRLISDSLKIAEDSLEKFRLSHSLINLSTEGTLIQNRLEKAENERYNLILQKQYYDYLLGYLDSKDIQVDIISPSTLGVNDPVLIKLIGDLSAFRQQKQQLELNISPDLPAGNLADEKINNTKTAIRENIVNSLENLKISISDVEQRIQTIENEIDKLPGTERKLISIQRDFDLNNTVYTYLLEKRAEAGIAKASNVPDNRQIDSADKYNMTLVRPRGKRNNMIALIIGLALPAVLILIIDYLNNKILDRKDVEKGTKAPILGFISHNDYSTELPVVTKPGSTLAESFRSVRTSLKYFLHENEHPVISISSTVSAEGKTFVSINLAAITAMLGKRVLLIGLDLRKPKIHKILEVDNETGMSTYLSGSTNYNDVIQKTWVDNLYYAPAGPVPPNPAELIASQRMGEFLTEARKEFDFIIIDTPPVAIVTDALLLASYADMNIFVVRQRYSSKNTLQLIEQFYQDKNLKNMSVIINDISLTGYYGYGLRYGYTIGYGGYSYGYNLYGDYVYGKYGYKKGNKEYYTQDSVEEDL